MKSRVKPLKPILPEEFSPNCRITSKKFAFTQSVPRVKPTHSTIPNKTFQEDSEPDDDKKENDNSSNEQIQSPNENDHKVENQSNDQNNEYDSKQQNDKDIIVNDDIDRDMNNEEEEHTSQSNSEQKQPTILDDEEMISLKDELMETHDFSQIGHSKLNQFFQYIKEYTKFTASQADYEEAKKAKVLTDETINAIYNKKNDKERSEEEKQEFEKKKAEQEERWQNEVDTYDQETQKKLDDLNKKQEDERKDLDDYWNEEKTLRKYSKPSARLLQLWRMEKFLAKTGSFDEAAIVRLEAEELAKRELALGQAMANRDYHIDKDKLVEKQNNDMTHLIKNRVHWREVMLSRQETEKAVIVNRESVVEVRQKEPLPKREAQLPKKRKNQTSLNRTQKSNGSQRLSRASTASGSSKSSKSSLANGEKETVDGEINETGPLDDTITGNADTLLGNSNDTKKSQTSGRRGPPAKSLCSPDISFNYCTLLPPIASPVTGGNNTPADSRSVSSEHSYSSCGRRSESMTPT